MRLRVGYFALLRERAGTGEETIETQAQTASDLYRELSGRHGFPLPLSQIKVAVNERFEHQEYVLQPDDYVVFIAPIAGG